MGCKKDDTCDQPATKGDIEQVKGLIVMGVGIVGVLIIFANRAVI